MRAVSATRTAILLLQPRLRMLPPPGPASKDAIEKEQPRPRALVGKRQPALGWRCALCGPLEAAEVRLRLKQYF